MIVQASDPSLSFVSHAQVVKRFAYMWLDQVNIKIRIIIAQFNWVTDAHFLRGPRLIELVKQSGHLHVVHRIR